MIHQRLVVGALALLALAPNASSQSGSSRTIETVDVGAGRAVALNVNGWVVFVQEQGSLARSFLWTPWSGARDVGSPDVMYPQTRAFDLSDSGDVVGVMLSRFGFYHPFIWTLSTGLVDADVDVTAESAAWAIGGGVIVGGWGHFLNPFGVAFYRSRDGVTTSGHPLGGSCGSGAYDVNMFRIAVGESSIPGFCEDPAVYRAFTWNGTEAQDLGTLGGMDSRALRINDLNQVIGDSTTAAGSRHAFLWSARDGMRDLGTLGGASSTARDISNMGHVVGTAEDTQGEQRAFLWTPTSGMVDLGPGEAVAVNRFDHVVGTFSSGGVEHAFLWTPSDGRIDFGAGTRAIDVNENGVVLGERADGTTRRVVLWHVGLVEEDWLAFRHGLVDAHMAWDNLPRGHWKALHAVVDKAERALRAGDRQRMDQALLNFARRLARWAPEELPWE